MRTFLLLFFFFSSLLANPLQDAIDKAEPYATIKLQNGLYRGNITINKPLRILGLGKRVTIEGDGKGSVVTITSSYVHLQNLTIKGSGERMHTIDAAISMHKARKCSVLSCRLEDVLYGIDMDMVSNSRFEDNYITSKQYDIGLRGDGIKMYYSSNNIITNNTIERVRDVTLNYSDKNIFTSNTFLHNRFATHLSLSRANIFKDNTYRYNSVGIMLMGAKDTKVIRNHIMSCNGAAGIAVMIGAVANFLFQDNIVRYNAKALYIDGKEKEQGIKRFIIHNEIAYNGEAFHFHATIKDNKIVQNRVFGNIDDVVKDISGSFADSNIVEYNYWDRYAGFDRDNDGVGDTPYKVYQYADALWHYNKNVKFFYASPIMTLLNFLSQLAPFIEPNLILVDKKPIYQSL
jgi:nitrous oxidase accessory protein